MKLFAGPASTATMRGFLKIRIFYLFLICVIFSLASATSHLPTRRLEEDHDTDHEEEESNTLFWHKMGALVVVLVIAIIGVVMPFAFSASKKLNYLTRLLHCCSAGMFLGLSFFHLLTEATVELKEANIGIWIGESFANAAYPILVAGFLLLFYVDKVMWLPKLERDTLRHHHVAPIESHVSKPVKAIDEDGYSIPAEDAGKENDVYGVNLAPDGTGVQQLAEKSADEAKQQDLTVGFVALLLSLSVHSVFEGGIIGIAANRELVWITTLSVVGHKWAEGFALSCSIMRARMKLRGSIPILIIFSLASPTGILIGWPLAKLGPAAVGITAALSLGTLMHVGMDMLYELFETRSAPCKRHVELLFVLLGCGLLYGLWMVHLTAHVH